MITRDILINRQEKYEEDLREFRLTGDMQYLVAFINDVAETSSSCFVQDFFNALTDNEKFAFQSIREEIGFSGNISVVKMIQKTNLSRPVFTSLLQKMEKYGVAEVKNQGVKGTNINIRKEVENA